MSKKANPALVGTFVIGAILLVIAAILYVGNLQLDKESYRCVLFFDGSLHGLDVGAPVTYRGVKIGTVSAIEIFFDKKNRNYRIPVYVDIDGSNSHLQDNYREAGYDNPEEFFASLIRKGLQAKLRMGSLITGKLFIEFTFNPDATNTQVVREGEYLRVPTAPSGLEQISQAIESLPIKSLMDKSMAVLDGAEKLINNPALHSGIDTVNSTVLDFKKLVNRADSLLVNLEPEIRQLLTDISSLAANADTSLDEISREISQTNTNLQPVIKELRTTLTSITGAAEHLVTTLENADKMTKENSELPFQLTITMTEVRKAARAIRDFADYLQRHPRALLTGPQEEEKK